MDFITQVQETLLSHLPAIVEEYHGKTEAENLSMMEKQVKQMTHELGNARLYPYSRRKTMCGVS